MPNTWCWEVQRAKRRPAMRSDWRAALHEGLAVSQRCRDIGVRGFSSGRHLDQCPTAETGSGAAVGIVPAPGVLGRFMRPAAVAADLPDELRSVPRRLDLGQANVGTPQQDGHRQIGHSRRSFIAPATPDGYGIQPASL